MLRINETSAFEVSRDQLIQYMSRPDDRDIESLNHIFSPDDAVRVLENGIRETTGQPGDVVEISNTCYMGQASFQKIPLSTQDILRPPRRGDEGMTRLQAVANATSAQSITLIAYDTRVSPMGYTIDENNKYWRKDFDVNVVYATTGKPRTEDHLTRLTVHGSHLVVEIVAAFLEAGSRDIDTALDAKWDHIQLRCYRQFCGMLINLLKDLTKLYIEETCCVHIDGQVGDNENMRFGIRGCAPEQRDTIGDEKREEIINVRTEALPYLVDALSTVKEFLKRALRGERIDENRLAGALLDILGEEDFSFQDMLQLTELAALNREEICSIKEMLCVLIYTAETELMARWYTQPEGSSMLNYKDGNMTRSVALDILELLDIDLSVLCTRKNGHLFRDEEVPLEIDFEDLNVVFSSEPTHYSYDSRGLRKLERKITARWGTVHPYTKNGIFLSQSPPEEIRFTHDKKRMRAYCVHGEILIFENGLKAMVKRALRPIESIGIAQVTLNISQETRESVFLCGSAAFNAVVSGKYGKDVALWGLAKCFARDILVNKNSPFTCFLPKICLSDSARTICNRTMSRSLFSDMVYATRETRRGVELFWLPMTSGRAFKVRPGTSMTHFEEDERMLGESYKLCRWRPRSRIGGNFG